MYIGRSTHFPVRAGEPDLELPRADPDCRTSVVNQALLLLRHQVPLVLHSPSCWAGDPVLTTTAPHTDTILHRLCSLGLPAPNSNSGCVGLIIGLWPSCQGVWENRSGGFSFCNRRLLQTFLNRRPLQTWKRHALEPTETILCFTLSLCSCAELLF